MGTSEQLEGGLSGGAARLTASAGETPAGRLSGDTTELGIDIISVGRIRRTLARFGGRFVRRVLTPSEQRYVRDRAETLAGRDRKSTRLNSSHQIISYAVFCLKKKKT